jgi:hypothetical protein
VDQPAARRHGAEQLLLMGLLTNQAGPLKVGVPSKLCFFMHHHLRSAGWLPLWVMITGFLCFGVALNVRRLRATLGHVSAVIII